MKGMINNSKKERLKDKEIKIKDVLEDKERVKKEIHADTILTAHKKMVKIFLVLMIINIRELIFPD